MKLLEAGEEKSKLVELTQVFRTTEDGRFVDLYANGEYITTKRNILENSKEID